MFCPPGTVNATIALNDTSVYKAWLASHPTVNVVLPGGGNVIVRNSTFVQPYTSGLTVNPLTRVGPILCPSGTYCMYGTQSNVTSFNFDGIVRPGYCFVGTICDPGASTAQAASNPVPEGFFAP